MEDYTAYYARCFHRYKRKCTRLHLFDVLLEEETLKSKLCERNLEIDEKQFNKNYLGFIVIKPLPKTIIGRTCIVTYPETDSRIFPVLRDYTVTFFGLKLKLKSIAYQEQDKSVAACATSALWSVFQSTGVLFHHSIPTPSKVTSAATENNNTPNRSLPSDGLTKNEIADAIREVDLEPFPVTVSDIFVLKTTLYGYLNAKIPQLLIIDVAEKKKTEEGEEYWDDIGSHALVVTGYNLGNKYGVRKVEASKQKELFEFEILKEVDFRCKALGINKIFVHDDQLGPFSKILIDEEQIQLKEQDDRGIFFRDVKSLTLNWRDDYGKTGMYRSVPDTLFLPLYHKIRIPFETVQDAVIRFNSIMEILRLKHLLANNDLFYWDIYLISGVDFKVKIFKSRNIRREIKEKVLMGEYPRFIWVSSLRVNEDENQFDIILDATDIDQGYFVCDILDHNQSFVKLLVAALSSDVLKFSARYPEWKIITKFRELKYPDLEQIIKSTRK